MKLGRMVTVILAAACVVSMAGCGQKQAPAGTAEAPKTTEAAKEAAAEPAAAENKDRHFHAGKSERVCSVFYIGHV